MIVKIDTTITLTPDEVRGAIIETLARLGYSAKPDQITLSCTMVSCKTTSGTYLPDLPSFHSAIIKNPEPIKTDRE